MGGIRNDDLAALCVAVGKMICLDQQKSGKFSVGASRRLKREVAHAGNRGQSVFCFFQDLQAALYGIHRLKRMNLRESFEGSRPFIDSRIVLHRAGSERIETVVYAVGLFGQFRIMSGKIDFRHLRQMKIGFSHIIFRKRVNIHVAFRKRADAPSGS